MTHCYNCGHAGTFVLLAQFALAVPGPDPSVGDDPKRVERTNRTDIDRSSPDETTGDSDRTHSGRIDGARYDTRRRTGVRRDDTASENDPNRDESDERNRRIRPAGLPMQGDLSFTVQCPACDSTDVGVSPADLLARHGATTTR